MAIKRSDRAEHAFLVAYDISDPKRWRHVFRTMKGFGQRLQLSVWHCRLSAGRRAELAMAMESLIDLDEDQVVIIDLGIAGDVDLKVEALGLQTFEPIERKAQII